MDRSTRMRFRGAFDDGHDVVLKSFRIRQPVDDKCGERGVGVERNKSAIIDERGQHEPSRVEQRFDTTTRLGAGDEDRHTTSGKCSLEMCADPTHQEFMIVVELDPVSSIALDGHGHVIAGYSAIWIEFWRSTGRCSPSVLALVCGRARFRPQWPGTRRVSL